MPAIVELVVAAGLFTREESALVADLYEAHFDGPDQGHGSVVGTSDDDRLTAVAYWRSREATDRVYDLTMIAVHPEGQRGGLGTALLDHVEATLRDEGQRLLLVETSSTSAFNGARAFYERRGYAEEARVRDYWAEGDDLVLFRQRLATG